jgi:hypothetical protein
MAIWISFSHSRWNIEVKVRIECVPGDGWELLD